MDKKIILITGSSRGIGRQIALTLAAQGHIIIANYNKSEEHANNLKQEALRKNQQIDLYKADVSNRDEVKKMIDFIINKYKRIDVLINNAGISSFNLFTDITDEEWNKTIGVNLNSVFFMSQETVKYMIKQKEGSIINISSIWGLVGASCEVAYSVSKAGVDGMTKSLAKELGPSNIRVNSIAPGLIDTDMNNDLTSEELENIINETPLCRIGKPEDIAKCVKWLVEDTFTTGQVISINGGWNII